MFLKRFVSSREWVAFFRKNAAEDAGLERPEAMAVLPPEIRRTIAASLPSWQLGETSDGRHLRAVARDYARKESDWDFLEAIDLFIAEENRHGAALGDWLDRMGIPRKSRDTGDTLFRFCRHLIGHYAGEVSVLVMMEAVAEIYYACVRRLVPCPRLRLECERMLTDEVKHIQFQCEHLAASRRHLHWRWRPILRAVELGFFGALCLAVWIAHGKVCRQAGLSLWAYFKAAAQKFRTLQRLIDPRRYDFGASRERKLDREMSSAGSGVIFYRLSSSELRRILQETRIKTQG